MVQPRLNSHKINCEVYKSNFHFHSNKDACEKCKICEKCRVCENCKNIFPVLDFNVKNTENDKNVINTNSINTENDNNLSNSNTINNNNCNDVDDCFSLFWSSFFISYKKNKSILLLFNFQNPDKCEFLKDKIKLKEIINVVNKNNVTDRRLLEEEYEKLVKELEKIFKNNLNNSNKT